MLDLAGLALAALVSRRELRFDPVPEQWAPEACGLAVATALGADPPAVHPIVQRVGMDGQPRPDPAGLVTLGELAGILEGSGVSVAPRRLGLADFGEALDRGFSPIVLHYDRPDPHWALLVGKGPWGYGVGDPARGFELLEQEELAKRVSGAVILVDPSTLAEGTRARMRQAFERAEDRMKLLSTLAGDGAEEKAGEAGLRPSVGIESRLALADKGRVDAAAASFDLRFSEDSSGMSMGAGIGASAMGGLFSLWPRIAFKGILEGDRRFASLGFAIGDEEIESLLLSDRLPYDPARLHLQIAAGLILDPMFFVLSLVAAPAVADGWEPWARVTLTTVEAINEVCSLEVACAYTPNLSDGDSTLALSLAVGFHAEAWRGEFGWHESGDWRALVIGGGAQAKLE